MAGLTRKVVVLFFVMMALVLGLTFAVPVLWAVYGPPSSEPAWALEVWEVLH